MNFEDEANGHFERCIPYRDKKIIELEAAE